ncbi:MAG: cytochrome P460 family protein [Nitrospinota bacterium]
MRKRGKWMAVAALIVALPFLALACAELQRLTGAAPKGPKMPPPEGKAVLTYLTETAPYGKYQYWPGKLGLYKGQHPHGAWLTLTVNDTALAALKKGAKVFPAGSIIAKENYTPDEKLDSLTVMYKAKGFDPEHNDWFWAKYNYAQGKFAVAAAGKVPGCIKCHELVENLDYVYNLKGK